MSRYKTLSPFFVRSRDTSHAPVNITNKIGKVVLAKNGSQDYGKDTLLRIHSFNYSRNAQSTLWLATSPSCLVASRLLAQM